MKKIVLYGAGGFGKEVAQIIEDINSKKPTYELLGFLDDGTEYHKGVTINGYPWLGSKEWIIAHKDDVFCNCTIGKAKTKAKIQNELTERGVQFETLISPYAGISKYTKIGSGCVLYRGVGISVNCEIGAGVLLNDGTNIGHDTIIGDYTTIMPGTRISGAVNIGSQVNIGAVSFIAPGKKVGDGATIAAGSIVFSNVRAGTTVLGNPARRMKELE